ncbi:hypothetical protein PEC302107_38180 [Pectobacterium araliae]|nr:hypothetical protein PEC302107_38180 [Pectobacterium carotovorum subsp. carotovorum]
MKKQVGQIQKKPPVKEAFMLHFMQDRIKKNS